MHSVQQKRCNYMNRVEINITPMSMKNGVMGLPIQCCRNWDDIIV